MIGLSKNGVYFTLSEGQSIPVNWVSPLFAKNYGFNSESYSFSIDLTPEVRELIDFQDNWLVPETGLKIPEVVLSWHTIPLKIGTLVINSLNPTRNTAQAVLLLDNSGPLDDLSEVSIKSLVYGNVKPPSTETAFIELDGIIDVAGSDAQLVINGNTYTHPGDVLDTVADILDAMRILINAGSPGNGVSAVINASSNLEITALVSGVDGDFTVDTDPPGNGLIWYLEDYLGPGEIVQNAWALLMQNASNSPTFYDYCFPPIYNSGYYSGAPSAPGSYLHYINLYNPPAGEYYKNSGAGPNFQVIVPQIKFKIVLEAILTYLGFTDTSAFTSTPDFLALHFYDNTSLDDEYIDENLSPNPVNWGKTNFDIVDHLPDITAGEFLNDLAVIANLGVWFTPELKEFLAIVKLDVLNGEVVDWREKSVKSYQVARISEKTYEFSWADDEADAITAQSVLIENLDGLTVGSGGSISQISTEKLRPLGIALLAHTATGHNWRVPFVNMPGNSEAQGLSGNPAGYRFFYFGGMLPDSQANDYPLASAGEDYAGDTIGAYEIRWTGGDAANLYTYFYEQWLTAIELEGRPGSHSALLSAFDLITYDPLKLLNMRTLLGGGNFLPAKLKAQLGGGEFSRATLDLIRYKVGAKPEGAPTCSLSIVLNSVSGSSGGTHSIDTDVTYSAITGPDLEYRIDGTGAWTAFTPTGSPYNLVITGLESTGINHDIEVRDAGDPACTTGNQVDFWGAPYNEYSLDFPVGETYVRAQNAGIWTPAEGTISMRFKMRDYAHDLNISSMLACIGNYNGTDSVIFVRVIGDNTTLGTNEKKLQVIVRVGGSNVTNAICYAQDVSLNVWHSVQITGGVTGGLRIRYDGTIQSPTHSGSGSAPWNTWVNDLNGDKEIHLGMQRYNTKYSGESDLLIDHVIFTDTYDSIANLDEELNAANGNKCIKPDRLALWSDTVLAITAEAGSGSTVTDEKAGEIFDLQLGAVNVGFNSDVP